MLYKEFAPKKDIEIKIYKDFFSDEELKVINKCIEDLKQVKYESSLNAPIIQEKLSRLHIELIYPEHILKKVEAFASDLCGEPVIMSHNSYYHYNKKYNFEMDTPKLQPHRDFDNYYTKLTLDYQLEKTVDWDLLIEGKRYSLEIGDMLAFWGAGLIHWRENIVLDENETSTVLTFHFANEDDYKKLNDLSRDPEDRKRRHEINSKDEDLKRYNLVWEQERVKFNNRKTGV